MKIRQTGTSLDFGILISVLVLVLLSLIVLNSISPNIFPQYYLFVIVGFLAFFLFTRIDFDILSAFSAHLYVLSIIFLFLPIVF